MENLLATWEKFLRGKRRRKDVILFQAKLGDNLANLYRSLADNTYKHGPYLTFNISDPKPRKIHKATVRDRVVHHLLHKELYPYFEKRFIYDSYSCRKEKGVHRALNRFKFFAGQVSKNNSRTCYVLKCDIRKFFASVDHETLVKILKRHTEDQNIICLLDKIISSFYTTRPGVGLPLGNLTSQLLANVYMHEFDMFMKQGLRVKHYIRYTDDFIILSEDKKYLDELLPPIEEFLRTKLKLSLHENKVSKN
jgi:retron-type reverse transcriptase